ncbi:MAG TPA: response regulator [Alphaproteobacteria bacterium]|nr:response regulator [Alphaproteobacteria bacterium]
MPLNPPPDDQKDQGVRVLVAEDNPAVREFITRSLAGVGHKVEAAADGQQALDALAKGTFAVLVADIVMPNMDGIALALKAVRLYPDLRIVMISGYAQERMRAHNLDALVHRIIAKPFSLEEICDAVKSAVALPPGTV